MAPRKRRTLAIAAVIVVAATVVGGTALGWLPWQADRGNECLVPPVPCLFDIHGEVIIGTDVGAGILNITVANEASYRFTNIVVLDAGPGLSGVALFSPFLYHDRVVSDSNKLDIGTASTGFYEFAYGGNTATTYTITVQVTMENGQTVTEKTNIVSEQA